MGTELGQGRDMPHRRRAAGTADIRRCLLGERFHHRRDYAARIPVALIQVNF
jgi:hypothetical protein